MCTAAGLSLLPLVPAFPLLLVVVLLALANGRPLVSLILLPPLLHCGSLPTFTSSCHLHVFVYVIESNARYKLAQVELLVYWEVNEGVHFMRMLPSSVYETIEHEHQYWRRTPEVVALPLLAFGVVPISLRQRRTVSLHRFRL
jgi:hypothetical protein